MVFDPNSPNVIEGINDDEPYDRKVMFLGRDINQIPCFKESFLYGFLGGIGCGLLTFMSTSRVGRATNVAVYSFSGIVLVYWVNCRLNWSRSKFTVKQSQTALEAYEQSRGSNTNSNTTHKTD